MNSIVTRMEQPETPPPWGVGNALVTVIVALLAMVMAFTATSIWLSPSPAAFLFGGILGAALTVLFVWQTRKAAEERAALRLTPPKFPLPLLLFLGLGIALVIDVLSFVVTRELLTATELLPLAVDRTNLVNWLMGILFMMVAQPVAEEVVFRGVLFPAVRKSYGLGIGMAFTAVLYGAFHLFVYTPGVVDSGTFWYSLVVPFLAGLALTGIRAYTGSTRAAIIAHAAFGLFALLKIFVMP